MRSTTSIDLEPKLDADGSTIGWSWRIRMPDHPTLSGCRPSWKAARRQARRELKGIVDHQRREDDRQFARSLSSGLDLQG